MILWSCHSSNKTMPKATIFVSDVSVSTRVECLMLWHHFRQSFKKGCNNMAALCHPEFPSGNQVSELNAYSQHIRLCSCPSLPIQKKKNVVLRIEAKAIKKNKGHFRRMYLITNFLRDGSNITCLIMHLLHCESQAKMKELFNSTW